MKIKTFLIFTLILILLLLTACNDKSSDATSSTKPSQKELENINKSGMPIVKKRINLTFLAGRFLPATGDWNNKLIWNKYKDLTNINVKWKMIPSDGLEEKRNLALASGDYPDVFYSTSIPKSDLQKYGEQGVFLPLNDLIDKYAPNVKKLFEQYPDIKKGLTFPDGNIYSLPEVFDPKFTSVLVSKLWIRKDWLKKFGITMPQTTEEYYQYLKDVKTKDPNGNGKQDEIPFCADGSVDSLLQFLRGSWGLQDRGNGHTDIDVDPKTNKLRYIYTDPNQKELWQYVSKLYKEGLINKDAFTVEPDKTLARGQQGVCGSGITPSPKAVWGQDHYEGAPTFKGPHGDRMAANIGSSLVIPGAFAITNHDKNPVATVKWMDYFYSDDGQKLFFMGVEGKTYKDTSSGPEYLKEITDNPDGLPFDSAVAKYMSWPGGGYPGIVTQKYFKGSEGQPEALKATKNIKPYIPKEIWAAFTFTKEENDQIVPIQTDINNYIKENKAKFITGKMSFSKWDKFVSGLKGIGLDQYMKIEQAAYERYKKSE